MGFANTHIFNVLAFFFSNIYSLMILLIALMSIMLVKVWYAHHKWVLVYKVLLVYHVLHILNSIRIELTWNIS